MWGFEAFAEGLSTADPCSGEDQRSPPTVLRKTDPNSALFDARGKRLDSEAAQKVTTWRSHHAFSGRCALVKSIIPGDTTSPSTPLSSTPCWAESAWKAYQNWSVAFRLRSVTAEEPHILLSVAPAYYPNLTTATGMVLEPDAVTQANLPRPPSSAEGRIYDQRTLETPLIWEEPYALSVDCTPRGVFLWSDHWGMFGKKIANRCLEISPPTAQEEARTGSNGSAPTVYDAVLRLRWSTPPRPHGMTPEDARQQLTSVTPQLSVDLNRSPHIPDNSFPTTQTDTMVEHSWEHLADVSLPLEGLACKAAFRPHATLMEGGDSVELL